jgi:hypothetical protein
MGRRLVLAGEIQYGIRQRADARSGKRRQQRSRSHLVVHDRQYRDDCWASTGSATCHCADNQQWLGSVRDSDRERKVGRLVRQILLAGEEPNERPTTI